MSKWHGKTGEEIYNEVQDILKKANLIDSIIDPQTNKINSNFLPSYIDEVIEGYYYDGEFYLNQAETIGEDENGDPIIIYVPIRETKIQGETGKIYIDLRSKGEVYRYTGTQYVKISDSVLENKISEVDSKLNETNNRIDRIESQPNPYSFGPKFPTSIEDEDGGFWDAQYKVQVGYIHSLTMEDQGYGPGLYRCIQCPADPFDTTDYKWQRIGGLL